MKKTIIIFSALAIVSCSGVNLRGDPDVADINSKEYKGFVIKQISNRNWDKTSVYVLCDKNNNLFSVEFSYDFDGVYSVGDTIK